MKILAFILAFTLAFSAISCEQLEPDTQTEEPKAENQAENQAEKIAEKILEAWRKVASSKDKKPKTENQAEKIAEKISEVWRKIGKSKNKNPKADNQAEKIAELVTETWRKVAQSLSKESKTQSTAEVVNKITETWRKVAQSLNKKPKIQNQDEVVRKIGEAWKKIANSLSKETKVQNQGDLAALISKIWRSISSSKALKKIPRPKALKPVIRSSVGVTRNRILLHLKTTLKNVGVPEDEYKDLEPVLEGVEYIEDGAWFVLESIFTTESGENSYTNILVKYVEEKDKYDVFLLRVVFKYSQGMKVLRERLFLGDKPQRETSRCNSPASVSREEIKDLVDRLFLFALKKYGLKLLGMEKSIFEIPSKSA